MRTLLLFLLFQSIPHLIFSQVKIDQNKIQYYKNEVGFELGGNCLFYSIYYQRELFKKNKVQFNVRIGGSLFPSFENSFLKPSDPLRIGFYILPNILQYKKKHAWEFGIGFNTIASFDKQTIYNPKNNTYDTNPNNIQIFLISPQIGYRIYLKNNKFYFRAAAILYNLIGSYQSTEDYLDVEPKVLPWAGFGFGYCFGKN